MCKVPYRLRKEIRRKILSPALVKNDATINLNAVNPD